MYKLSIMKFLFKTIIKFLEAIMQLGKRKKGRKSNKTCMDREGKMLISHKHVKIIRSKRLTSLMWASLS